MAVKSGFSGFGECSGKMFGRHTSILPGLSILVFICSALWLSGDTKFVSSRTAVIRLAVALVEKSSDTVLHPENI